LTREQLSYAAALRNAGTGNIKFDLQIDAAGTYRSVA
jgi:hypothetical protein